MRGQSAFQALSCLIWEEPTDDVMVTLSNNIQHHCRYRWHTSKTGFHWFPETATNLDFLQKVRLERALSTIKNPFNLLQFLKIRLINHLKTYLIGEKSNVLYQAPVAQFNWKREHICVTFLT